MQSTRTCLSSPSSSPLLVIPFPSSSSSFYFFAISRRHITIFCPLSSLRESKKATLLKATNVPQNIRFEDRKGRGDGGRKEDDEGELGGDSSLDGTILTGILLAGVVGGFGAVGYLYKEQINAFGLNSSVLLTLWARWIRFICAYLFWTRGLLFCSVTGTIIASISGAVAASVAFLIARYFARERILKLVEGNKKFLAIDKAIGENGFRVVTLL